MDLADLSTTLLNAVAAIGQGKSQQALACVTRALLLIDGEKEKLLSGRRDDSPPFMVWLWEPQSKRWIPLCPSRWVELEKRLQIGLNAAATFLQVIWPLTDLEVSGIIQLLVRLQFEKGSFVSGGLRYIPPISTNEPPRYSPV